MVEENAHLPSPITATDGWLIRYPESTRNKRILQGYLKTKNGEVDR